MSSKGWIIFVGIIVLVFGGAIYLSKQNRINVDGVDIAKVIAGNADNGNIADHTYGNKDAKVVLIEYGDYQCPGCGAAAPAVKDAMSKYSDKVLLVFRNKLIPGHANARAAASFAEAAGLQGKYWEMHDKLYANQSAWESLSSEDRTNYFLGLTNDLGLDQTKVKADVESDAVAKKIAFDEALATKRGVTGTPSIYLNGTIVDQHYKDSALTTDVNDSYVWSNATAFETLILVPALKSAGLL
jgi:hypothetical protein